MTYAVVAYLLAAMIWTGYFLSLRFRAAKLEVQEKVTSR